MSTLPYLTTSLMPSGNRFVTDAFCPGITTPREFEVKVSSIEDALGVANEGVGWIVGTPSEALAFWFVTDKGNQYTLGYGGSSVAEWNSPVDSPDRPLVLDSVLVLDGQGEAITSVNSTNSTSTTTHTAYLPLEAPPQTSPYSAAVPTPNGGLLLVEQKTSGQYQLTQLAADHQTDVTHESLRLRVENPLPDSAIAYSSRHNLWALYTGATDVYDHAVLGDAWEGGALTVLEWNSTTQLVEHHGSATLQGEPQANTVFEGLGPMWADINGDGQEDIVTTVSNAAVGARLRVYSLEDPTVEEGSSSLLYVLAQAEAINRGGRWLHQLAVGALGPNGETELVEIRTPHIGGIVRYYRLEEEAARLKLVASTSRYTSHDIRSRNLDRAIAGDFDGDGVPELVVQTQAKDELVALQRSANGVEIVWSVPLPSPVESNLAVGCSSGGEEDDESSTMEIVFSTKNNQLVRVRFAPTDIEVERSASPGNEKQDDNTENSSGSAPSFSSSLHQSVLGLGLHLLLLVWLVAGSMQG